MNRNVSVDGDWLFDFPRECDVIHVASKVRNPKKKEAPHVFGKPMANREVQRALPDCLHRRSTGAWKVLEK